MVKGVRTDHRGHDGGGRYRCQMQGEGERSSMTSGMSEQAAGRLWDKVRNILDILYSQPIAVSPGPSPADPWYAEVLY